jgi:hypothetical protein
MGALSWLRGERYGFEYVRRAALCTGCHQDSGRESPVSGATYRVAKDAREWAQGQAEHCRALPKPTT